jgi:hypothetical protein
MLYREPIDSFFTSEPSDRGSAEAPGYYSHHVHVRKVGQRRELPPVERGVTGLEVARKERGHDQNAKPRAA